MYEQLDLDLLDELCILGAFPNVAGDSIIYYLSKSKSRSSRALKVALVTNGKLMSCTNVQQCLVTAVSVIGNTNPSFGVSTLYQSTAFTRFCTLGLIKQLVSRIMHYDLGDNLMRFLTGLDPDPTLRFSLGGYYAQHCRDNPHSVIPTPHAYLNALATVVGMRTLTHLKQCDGLVIPEEIFNRFMPVFGKLILGIVGRLDYDRSTVPYSEWKTVCGDVIPMFTENELPQIDELMGYLCNFADYGLSQDLEYYVQRYYREHL